MANYEHQEIREAFESYLNPDEQLRYWAYGTKLLRGRMVLIAVPCYLLGMLAGAAVSIFLFGLWIPWPLTTVVFLLSVVIFSTLFMLPFLPFTIRVYVVGLTTNRLLFIRLKPPLSGLADLNAKVSVTEYSLDDRPSIDVSSAKGATILALKRQGQDISVAFVDALEKNLPGNTEHARCIIQVLKPRVGRTERWE